MVKLRSADNLFRHDYYVFPSYKWVRRRVYDVHVYSCSNRSTRQAASPRVPERGAGDQGNRIIKERCVPAPWHGKCLASVVCFHYQVSGGCWLISRWFLAFWGPSTPPLPSTISTQNSAVWTENVVQSFDIGVVSLYAHDVYLFLNCLLLFYYKLFLNINKKVNTHNLSL